MEFYEQLKKVETSAPPKDFKIVDEWNQYGRVDCVQRVKSNCDIVRDTIKKGLPVSLYDEETGKQTVFMTEEGYKEMNDWWNGPPD